MHFLISPNVPYVPTLPLLVAWGIVAGRLVQEIATDQRVTAAYGTPEGLRVVRALRVGEKGDIIIGVEALEIVMSNRAAILGRQRLERGSKGASREQGLWRREV